MGARWFNVVVVVFWLSTMTWLLVSKVLPPLRAGQPPVYRELSADRSAAPVAWEILWNQKSVGWAASRTDPAPGDGWRQASKVHFERFPLRELLPTWLRSTGMIGDEFSALSMDLDSSVWLDAKGGLERFESSIRLAQTSEVIHVEGKLDGHDLDLAVRSGDVTYPTRMYLPAASSLSDEFSPPAELRGLSRGQTWTMPVFSPLRPPNSPLEILQATVERDEILVWNGQAMSTWVVVYRSDSGSGRSGASEQRGRVWVRPNGQVLKQEVTVFRSQLHFVRLDEGGSKALGVDFDADDPALLLREGKARARVTSP